MSILITSLLNSEFGRLSPFYLVLSLEFCSVLSFVSSFCLSPCVCFCVLGRSAMSPGLDRLALCSRHPRGPSGTDSLVSEPSASGISLVWVLCVLPPVVIEL